MLRPRSCFAALTALLLTTVAVAHAAAPDTLPLKRVRLYETGVGYFERSGRIDGGQGSVSLPVPAGHLDDALKTLVVLSEGGESSVQSIEFRSSASRPLALALAGLPSEPAAPMRYDALLGSLKGAPVEIRAAGGAHRGRLIEVLAPDAAAAAACAAVMHRSGSPASGATDPDVAAGLAACAAARSATLLLLTDRSEIRRFRAAEVTSVRPLDDALQARLATALDALSQRGAQTRRQLHVQARGGASVTLGYVAEAPIWRSTYRLVLPGGDQAASLQGWALLHNDTDEDWQRVAVELVNGQPDSFLFPLAAPRYERRELVTPERELSTVPQLLDTTVDNMWTGEGMGSLGLSGIGEGGGGRGEGIGHGRLGMSAHVRMGATSVDRSSGLLTVGNLAAVANAEGEESGALFRYAMPAPVDLRGHGSALLPFLQHPVTARQIAVLDDPGATPRSAVHLTNDTQQTLPPGTIAVFAAGGFAGESALSRTKPAETRIVSFGFDLDVELTHQGTVTTDTPKVLAYADGVLTEHYLRHHHVTYQLANRSGSPRSVYLQLKFVRNSRIAGVDDTSYDSESDTPYGVFRVAPKTRERREVDVHEGLQRYHDVGKLDTAAVERFAAAPSLPATQRKLLGEAAAHYRDAARSRAAKRKAAGALAKVEGQAVRLRENIRATSRAAADAAGVFVERLVQAEERADALRREIERHGAAAKRQLAAGRKRLRQLAAKQAQP